MNDEADIPAGFDAWLNNLNGDTHTDSRTSLDLDYRLAYSHNCW